MRLLRRSYRLIDTWLDNGVLSNCWQKAKWQLAYTFLRDRRIPAFDDLIKQPHRGALIAAIAEFSNLESLLEVGCGRGQNLYLLARARPEMRLHGIDISSAAIADATKELAARRAPGIELRIGSADALSDFPTASIDVVIADAVTMYVPPGKIVSTLAEMARVASKGLVLGTWHQRMNKGTESPLYDEGTWIYDYVDLLERVGCVTIKVAAYPRNAWVDTRWNRYGAIVTAAPRPGNAEHPT